MWHIVLYILATLLANYTADWFIPLPMFGLVSVGTLFFGITFTQRDRIHLQGRAIVYRTILIAAAANVMMSVALDVPWRIILASFVTILLAETADTEIYQRAIRRPWIERVARSNSLSVPMDTVLFTLIAFAGVYPLRDLAAIMVGDIVLKFIISMLTAGWYLATSRRVATA